MNNKRINPKEIEQFIFDEFHRNYELLQLEGGHSLSPEIKRLALHQVRMYYRRMNQLAETVTDTEVKLTLPELTTSKGNKFSIEGVVDIVREQEKTTMYDIKTHGAESVKASFEVYEKQLNIYAYIWQELRGEELDETAIIATQLPDNVREALELGDEAKLHYELTKWDPLIPINFSQENVTQTINEFKETVDNIEDGVFEPTPIEKLKDKVPGTRVRFATRVCRNCDARFSCSSYRQYALSSKGAGSNFTQYINDLGTDTDNAIRANTSWVEQPPILNIEDYL